MPPRLLVDPVEPFETQLPAGAGWRALHLAGQNVERAADAHDEGHAEFVTMGGEEALLPGRGHADEEAVGAALRISRTISRFLLLA